MSEFRIGTHIKCIVTSIRGLKPSGRITWIDDRECWYEDDKGREHRTSIDELHGRFKIVEEPPHA